MRNLWTPRRPDPPSAIDSPGVSGISNLLRTIEVNGTVVDSATSGFFYDLSDATGASGSMTLAEANGQAAGALTEAGGGALTRGTAGPFRDGSTGGTADGTGYLETASAFFDPGSDDAVIVLAVRQADTLVNGTLLGFYNSAGNVHSLEIGPRADGTYRLFITSSATNAFLYTPAVPAGELAVLVFVLDRSGSGVGYANAVAGSAVDISAQSGALSAAALTVFGRTGSGPAGVATGTLYCGAAWHGAAWLDSHLQPALANELTDRVFGLYAAQARGAARTLSVTRASTRYFDLGSAGIHALGAGGHCVEEDADGRGYVSVYGEYENVNPYPHDRTQWSNYNTTDAATAIATPFDGVTWARVVETAANAGHSIYIGTGNAPAQNQKVLIQGLLYPDDRRMILQTTNAEGRIAVCIGMDGTVTDTGEDGDWTLHASGSIPTANGYWVWAVGSSADATPGNLNCVVALADSDEMSGAADDIYLGAPGSYPLGGRFCGVMSVIGATGPLPFIAGGATKAAEVLTRPVAWINGADDFTVEFLFRRYGLPAGTAYLLGARNASNHQCAVYCDTAGKAKLFVTDGSNTINTTSNVVVCDGTWHRIRAGFGFKQGIHSLSIDGVVKVLDTTTQPAGPLASTRNALYILQSSSGDHANGDIMLDPQMLKVWPYARH